jgi:PilZ domain
MLTLTHATLEESQLDDGIERRRGLRINQSRPIKVFEPTTSRYFGGQTQDVSTTGLRLELPAHIQVRPGKILSIHVGLSETGQPLANRRQMIPARVIWVTRPTDTTTRTLSAGVEFLATVAAQLDAA